MNELKIFIKSLETLHHINKKITYTLFEEKYCFVTREKVHLININELERVFIELHYREITQ